jgi:hypothetical protein
MKHNQNPCAPKAATDEPASSPQPSSLPAAFEPELGRSGADPSLTSTELVEAYTPATTDARGYTIRHDGFTPQAQTVFLSVLALCGVVADACRAAGVSRDTVYAFRNSPRGHAFALAWDAAILIARRPVSDELMSRVMNGCVERIYRNGELWGERHRHDNRLAMAVLTRLDRQVAELGEGVATARVIAQDWEGFLAVVGAGGEEADAFLAARAPEQREPEAAKEVQSAAAMLAKLKTLRLHQEGRAQDIRTGDLDPARMDGWTDEQWLRADLSGFLDRLAPEDWPEQATDPVEARFHGKCRSRQVYLARHPDAGHALAGDGFDVWEDEDEGLWMTDYPPPEGFDGYEEGEWGDEDYKRALSEEEQVVLDAEVEADRAEEVAERARALEEARAARDRAFGFAPSPPAKAPAASGPEGGEGAGRPRSRSGPARSRAS